MMSLFYKVGNDVIFLHFNYDVTINYLRWSIDRPELCAIAVDDVTFIPSNGVIYLSIVVTSLIFKVLHRQIRIVCCAGDDVTFIQSRK